MTRTHAVLSSLSFLLVASVVAAQSVPQQVPAVVKGWREYPVRDGVISIQLAKWRTDKVLVPVPAGKASNTN